MAPLTRPLIGGDRRPRDPQRPPPAQHRVLGLECERREPLVDGTGGLECADVEMEAVGSEGGVDLVCFEVGVDGANVRLLEAGERDVREERLVLGLGGNTVSLSSRRSIGGGWIPASTTVRPAMRSCDVSPRKRRVRWNCSGRVHRAPSRSARRSASRRRTASGTSRATNRRGIRQAMSRRTSTS